MKIKLIFIGKTESKYLKQGIQDYMNRLKHYCKTEIVELEIPRNMRSKSEEVVKNAEGELILKQLQPGDQLILLDEKGDANTSRQFSMFLQKQMNAGLKNLNLVIGGPFGFSETVYKRSNGQLALSKMTFTHEMVRLFLVEQLYRGMTIWKGEKYHHD